MFSRLDIDDERDRENELSNLSTRPVVDICKENQMSIKKKKKQSKNNKTKNIN